MKTILVTGGAGFLGAHLCRRLLHEGNRVICLDNLETGRRSAVSDLEKSENFSFLQCDVIDLPEINCDAIFNLACPASPVHYQRDPIHTLKTSVLGAIRVLDLATKLDIPVLQASTSEVYGNAQIHPQTEDYWGNVNPDGIRACYDEGKRCAETLFFDYHRKYGTKIKVVRIFNTYGPGMQEDDGRVVTNFILQALCGENITVYGDGTQTRSFCYVDDLIEGLVRMIRTGNDITGPVNLGNPGEFTVSELAEMILRITGSPSELQFNPLPSDDPVNRRPSIELAKKLLDWEPETALEDGLKKTIAYYACVLSVS